MLLADGFWEIKNLNDVIAIVGLALTLLSIWLAVYFARRDLQRTIEEARKEARAALERFALTLLQRELAELGRWLRDARDASRRKEWARAAPRLDDAEVQIEITLQDPRLSDEDEEALLRAADGVLALKKAVAKVQSAAGNKTLSPVRFNNMDRLIRSIAALESRIHRRMLEATDDVPRSDGIVPPPPPADPSGQGDVGVPRRG